MRILAFGDVVGKTGRRCLSDKLDSIRHSHNPDCVIVNGENSAGGFGITQKVFRQFTDSLGIDCITTGNHWRDKPDVVGLLGSKGFVVPGNMGNVSNEVHGCTIFQTKAGRSLAVINVIGKVFMHAENRDPFTYIDKTIARLPSSISVRIVDIHAEATSEKQALAQHIAGRVSLVYGTHSHVPTADARILQGHTGYLTDIGMTGAYDSVIGIETGAAIHRFRTGEKKKFEPATKDPWLCYLVADIDDNSGKCNNISRFTEKLNDDPS